MLTLLAASRFYAVINERAIRRDISGLLFGTLEYSIVAVDGKRYFDCLFYLPTYFARILFPDADVVAFALYSTGFLLVGSQLLSIWICSKLIKHYNLNPNYILFPVLSYTAGTMLSANWIAMQTHTISLLLWPLVFILLSPHRSRKENTIAIFLLLSLCFTHEAAIFSLAVLFAYFAYRIFQNYRTQENFKFYAACAVISLIGIYGCYYRSFVDTVYKSSHAHVENYNKFFMLFRKDPYFTAQMLIVLLVTLFFFLKMNKVLNKIFTLILAGVVIYYFSFPQDLFYTDIYRIYEPFVVAGLFALFLLVIYRFKNEKENSPLFRNLVIGSVILAANTDIRYNEQWDRAVSVFEQFVESSHSKCIEIDPNNSPTEEFIANVYFPFPFKYILAQKSKKISYLAFRKNPNPQCERVIKEKTIPIYGPTEKDRNFYFYVPLNKPNTYFDFSDVLNDR
ncbi:MAG: hypothetical protein ACXVAX_03005 [Pseudobdellovibrio sp.]